jgi:hypothetical protein
MNQMVSVIRYNESGKRSRSIQVLFLRFFYDTPVYIQSFVAHTQPNALYVSQTGKPFAHRFCGEGGGESSVPCTSNTVAYRGKENCSLFYLSLGKQQTVHI